MQVLELPRHVHPYFIGAQFHPELTSRPLAPQPMFMGLVASAILRADPDRVDDARLAPWLYKGGEMEGSDPSLHVPSPCNGSDG